MSTATSFNLLSHDAGWLIRRRLESDLNVKGEQAVATGVAAAAAALVWFAVRHVRQNRRIDELASAFARAQLKAVRSVPQRRVPAAQPGPVTSPLPEGEFVHAGPLKFLYTVDQDERDDFVHHVVAKGVAPGPLSEVMLLFMGILVRQFTPAGMEHQIMLHVEVHESGTQHIDFVLDPQQHEALKRVIHSVKPNPRRNESFRSNRLTRE